MLILSSGIPVIFIIDTRKCYENVFYNNNVFCLAFAIKAQRPNVKS